MQALTESLVTALLEHEELRNSFSPEQNIVFGTELKIETLNWMLREIALFNILELQDAKGAVSSKSDEKRYPEVWRAMQAKIETTI